MSAIKKIKEKFKRKKKTDEERGRLWKFSSRLSAHPVFGSDFFLTPVLAFVLLLLIEGFGYKSPIGGLIFLFDHPGAFFVNFVLLFTCLSVAWLFKRRIFFYTVIFAIWSSLGIINGIILSFRLTPFTTADLAILDMGIDMFNVYFNTVQKTIAYGGIALLILFFIWLFIFGPRRKKKMDSDKRRSLRNRLVAFVLSCLFLVGTWNIGLATGMVSSIFTNLWDAYKDYGMPYGFVSTWLLKGISKPRNYSQQSIEAIFAKGELSTMTSDKKDFDIDNQPNIIFLQMESFIDPEIIKTVKLSDSPVPYFRELKEKYSTGYLTVPVVGGGTANTEFEVMTGMSVREFGPGEYPYKTILKKETCESAAFNLRELGFTAHAIHNHRAAFYNRNKVFRNLGFDTFTSIEYMNYVTKTQKNFARDDVLIGEILGALQSTEGKDYIYTISVQGHGEYPPKRLIKNPKFTVTTEMETKQKYAWEFYLEQVSEMDDFLRMLCEELDDYDEDVIMVVYGDHLPALPLGDSDMVSGSMFDTEYIVWSNYNKKKDDKDLYSFQLSAELQRQIGLRQGTMTVLHQDKKDSPNYGDYIHSLMYDILYGNRYIYGGINPFPPSDMQMGFNPIIINEVVEMGGEYYISGEGFTPFSKVTLNGKVLKTIFIGPTALKLIDEVNPADVGDMKVSQVEKYNEILSTTE